MQPAEILRAAAKAARDEWSSETSGPFKKAARIHLAVADWLDALASTYEALAGEPTSITYLTPGNVPTMPEALTVARAYLGEQA